MYVFYSRGLKKTIAKLTSTPVVYNEKFFRTSVKIIRSCEPVDVRETTVPTNALERTDTRGQQKNVPPHQ